jgi:maleate isomerase
MTGQHTTVADLEAKEPARPAGYDNVIGPRARFGVIAPSTNTTVEADLMMIRPEGVSFHTGRMYIAEPVIASNEDFEALIGQIRESINTAVRDVMTCFPSYMLMGMSAETFWGGVAGNQAFIDRIRERTGLGVSTGASSCRAALDGFGAKRISVFSPYQPIADEQVSTYFTEAGFDVRAVTGLRCPSATAIAEVGRGVIADVVAELDSPEVDAIVQVGTNLSFVEQAAELEKELGKPVIAINVATLWHALRTNGIDDRIAGFGRTLEEL